MFKNETDFKNLISRLNIDTQPAPAHRQTLRREMLSAFNQTWQKPLHLKTIVKSKITKLAAAAVIVLAIGLFLVERNPKEQPESQIETKVAKSPAELLTLASLNFAYRTGGMDAAEKLFDKAEKKVSPGLKERITIEQLICEL